MEIKLGSTVRDKISGFTGIATGRTTYLFGCVRVTVTPVKIKEDGSLTGEDYCFDEPQLEVVSEPDENLIGKKKKKEPTHGPREAVKRRSDFIKNIHESKRRA